LTPYFSWVTVAVYRLITASLIFKRLSCAFN
jgi:hypothetical protein